MNYEQFAWLYDELMSDVPYEQWVAFLAAKCEETGVAVQTVLDLACGTGNITLPLVTKGYDVTGVDLSEEMLTVAHQKLQEAGYTLALYQQDMRELVLEQQFDCVTIFCDSLNYVTEESGVQATFARVYEHVRQGGLFVFDVHSLYKMHEIFIDQTYTVNEEHVALIWQCFQGEFPNSVEHDMTFFVQDGDMYQRFDELHVQRAYPTEQLQMWLEEAGFTIVSITDEKMEPVQATTERIFFVAQKKSYK